MLTHSLGRVAKYALQDPWETFSGVSLCLKGGYAVNELLLSDASMSEVLARVAFQLIVQDYHCYPDEYDSPAAGMFGLYRALQKSGYKALATWVLAYAVSWAPLVTTSALREMFVQRERAGHTWRSVAYSAYKANRGDDPRVTNWGVISPQRREVRQ